MVVNKSQKVLVVGASSWLASGFLKHAFPEGRNVCNHQLVTVSRKSPASEFCHHYQGEASDFSFMKNIILDERPDVVVNFCGTALPDTKLCEMVSVNVGITTNILHALASVKNPARFIGFGSAAEYGTASGSQISELAECHPKTGYGITKYQQTVFGLDMSRRIPNTVVFLRPFNLLGCNMPPTTIAHLLWEKARQCKDGDTMTLFFPENIRDFIGVEDVAAAAWSVIESKPESGVFNVCSGEAKSLREVCESMLSALGIQATILQDPQYVGQQTAIDRIVGDGTKIMNACGWTAANSLDPVFRELAANNE